MARRGRCLDPFERLESWDYAPLNSSDAIAAEIARRWGEAASDAGRAAASRMSARRDAMKVPVVPLVVATALFMENTDSTILATAPADHCPRSGLGSDLAEARRHVLPGQPSGVHSGQRLGRRSRGRLHHLPVALGGIHDRLDRLRVLELARPVRLLARGPGLGGAMMVPVGRMVVIRRCRRPSWCARSPSSPCRR